MGIWFALAVTCLSPSSVAAATAGWYRVDNYVGSIGADPIHFSIQTYADFGSGITAEGSYFSDAKQSPIAIYRRARGKTLELCEIPDDKALDRILWTGSKTPVDTAGCPFALDLRDGGATGTWTRGATIYLVALEKVATLDDTGETKVNGTVAIPFWAQTPRSMFSGIYENTKSGVCMRKLQIINKGDKTVEQELDFDKDGCAGTLMTAIYWNVEKRIENGADVISINFQDGGAGHATDYVFNRATRKYSKRH